MKKILIVDDDVELCNLLQECLERDGYVIETTHDGNSVKNKLNQELDLIILDVMLPEINGFDVLKQIRGISNIPVLMLSAKGNEIDKVFGLKLGADDYIAKPFGLAEFMARVDSLVRRYNLLGGNRRKNGMLNFEGLKIDLEKCIVLKNNKEILLTAKEYELICFLAKKPKKVFTKKQIYQNVWKQDYVYDDNTIMALIRRVRKKIEDYPEKPKYIQNVRGLGYKFNKECIVDD